jgi:RNA polymerase sigma factor (sigma-70 family)
MSGPPLNILLQQLRGLARPPDGGLTDGQLLARWLASRDEAAFELLIWRHGPTVLGVCQRLLRRSQDIEDAFQATFLVFLRKAGTIGKRDAVASWLYKVAYRMALRARMRSARQELLDGRDVLIPAPGTPDAVAWRDVRHVLDDEVSRLPARYRAVFVLCCLQGKTNGEAARELGVPTGTVLSQLSRARARLRARLTRRGVTLTAGALAADWAGEASAGVSLPLASSTLRAALAGTAEKAAAAGLITAQAAALTKGALQAMWLTKLKATTALVLSMTLIGGGGALTYRTFAAGPANRTGAETRADEPAGQGNGNTKTNDGDQNPGKLDRAGNLPQAPADAQARADVSLAENLEKLRAENAALAIRVKLLEEKLARAERSPGAPASRSVSTATVPPYAADRTTATGRVPPATVQDARDALEILRAQRDVKRAELEGAMIALQASQRSAQRIEALAKTAGVSHEEIDAAHDKVALDKVAVRVKEAQLQEQEIRLQQATRRLNDLQGAKAGERAAPPPVDQQQLKELRTELDQLRQKIDGLEKSTPPPSQKERRR